MPSNLDIYKTLAKPLRGTRFFGHAHFTLLKRKKTLDLQGFSQIGKTMKMLQ